MYYILVNPASKSGRGLRIFEKLEPVLRKRKIPYELIQSTHVGQITEIVKDLTASSEKIRLIVLGGDGTMNEVLQGIRDFSLIEIGYIPSGSSNDLARALHLPKDPLILLDRILNGNQKCRVDLGKLTYTSEDTGNTASKYFIVSSGIGFDAAVCEESISSPFKNTLNKLKLGKLTYVAIALKQLIAARRVSCDLMLDDHKTVHMKRFLFIAAMNHPYEGGGFMFCPNADNTDGILDLCAVGPIPKPLILFALPTAYFGKHTIFPEISLYRASKTEIRSSIPLWVHTDGEVHFKSRHICLSCKKQALTLL